ncbi:unnamed protein product [Chrysoparadoxa australica]
MRRLVLTLLLTSSVIGSSNKSQPSLFEASSEELDSFSPQRISRKRQRQTTSAAPPLSLFDEEVAAPNVCDTEPEWDVTETKPKARKKKWGSRSLGAAAMHQARTLKREVKLYTSSTWESSLLLATWPDDQIPADKLVNKIVEGVRMFERSLDVTKNTSEHRVLLRKLWSKMSEKDARSKIKALYLLHRILSSLPPDDAIVLRKFMEKMSREFCKKTHSKYFNEQVLLAASTGGLEAFLPAYSKYVWKRARTFSGGFEELKVKALQWEHLIAVLIKGQKLVDVLLACSVPVEEETELAVLCMQVLREDAFSLMALLYKRLCFAREQLSSPSFYSSADLQAVTNCIEKMCTWYVERRELVLEYCDNVHHILEVWSFTSKSNVTDIPAPSWSSD